MASLAEWLSVRLRTKWLCVRISLLWLFKAKIYLPKGSNRNMFIVFKVINKKWCFL